MTTATPTLYESKGSPNARRVRIFIAEKGIDIPAKPVDLGAKEQFSDAYRAINPRGQVPALAFDDGAVIGEVLAIWRYLEEAGADWLARTNAPEAPTQGNPWSATPLPPPGQ
jgi:glutathione S-transferase